MTRLNIILLALLLTSAAAVITAQHQARKLYAELERERQIARQIETEWGQLQIEQSTWSMHSHVEKVASARLRMAAPAAQQTELFDPNAPLVVEAPVE